MPSCSSIVAFNYLFMTYRIKCIEKYQRTRLKKSHLTKVHIVMRADEKFNKKKWVKVIERLRRINSVANIYKWWILNASRYLVDFFRKMRGKKISGGWWRSKIQNSAFFHHHLIDGAAHLLLVYCLSHIQKT